MTKLAGLNGKKNMFGFIVELQDLRTGLIQHSLFFHFGGMTFLSYEPNFGMSLMTFMTYQMMF